MEPLLKAKNIDKHYDGVHALDHVDFAVNAGEVHALIGENGAGKSTLGKIIAGVVQADSGRLCLEGEPVSIRRPMEAQRLGISIIFQELDLFPNLTIAENIVIGNLTMEKGPFVRKRQLEDYCRPFMEQVGLDVASSKVLSDIPIGQMQLTAIARALSMNARLIIMDEPTSSLEDDAVDTLFGLIHKLKRSGVSIVYVSHKMDEIFRIADRITVLRDGRVAGTREADTTNSPELIRLMVGRDIGETRDKMPTDRGEVVLSVRDLSTAAAIHQATTKLKGISFDVHAGEVLGIAGLAGAGRSEVGAALFGLDDILSGSISIHGNPVAPRSPRHAIRSGIGLLPEDRKLQGLMMTMSVRDNTSLSVLDRLNVAGFVRHGREAEAIKPVHSRIMLKAASPKVAVNTLSGGNQQKVLLSKWLLVDPDVIFLDDPTRGIDVGAKQDIYGIIADLAHAGKGVIFVSSELPELLRCCDRIMVLHEGENAGIVDACGATQEDIMALATTTALGTEE